jgi:hypothetical protein
MKPIHKLNNGRGATLCHTCSVIITTGLTEDLYCKKCKPKQETLEEAFEKWSDEIKSYTKYDVLRFGAKWQQERSYSEEEVKHIISEALQSASVKVNLEQWFKQFKKK